MNDCLHDTLSSLTESRTAIIAADGTFTYQELEDASRRVAGALLADADHAVAEKYGVWQEKSLYGRTFMGIARTTYLIGPDGKVVQRWDHVKVDGHVEAVADALAR